MNIYITDKSVKKFWNTSVSAEWSHGERNNLNRHLQGIKSGNPFYAKCNIDQDTAQVVCKIDKWDRPATNPSLVWDDKIQNASDEELLKELGI